MRKLLLSVCLGLVLGGCGSSVTAEERVKTTGTDSRRLEIQLTGVLGREGNVVLAVYDNQDAFDREGVPLAWVSVPAQSKSFVFTDFPSGNIAVAAFHDTNRNGEYDMQGDTPLEGWGHSGNISSWTEPSYEAAVTDQDIIRVQMRYYTGGQL